MGRWKGALLAEGGHISLLSLLVSWWLAVSTTPCSCSHHSGGNGIAHRHISSGMSFPSLRTCQPPCPALTPAFTDSLLYTHTCAVCTDRGKATRVWVLHDSRQGRSLSANMEKSCSFCEAGCRTDFSCVVTCWRDSFLPQLLFLFRLMDEAQTYLTGKVNSWGV